MNPLSLTMTRTAAALLLLGSVAALPEAYAVGTAANTSIQNRATISYSVGGTAQTPIESSPTGNSVPGVNAGTATTFVVDNRVDLTVTEQGAAATVVNPAQLAVVTTFLVTNTGNAAQAYQLTAANVAAGASLFSNTDNSDVANLRVFVDANANGTYEAATDTATAITTLAADAGVRVFIVADVPTTATNLQFANVRLTAATAVNNTPATLLTASTGADNPATVEVVFADGTSAGGDAARNGRGAADDQYAVQSAALTVTKTSAVIRDPLNGTTDPKAIPLSVVEYRVTVANTGSAAASGVTLDDPIPANTAFLQNEYSGATRDVQVTTGTGTVFCIAEVAATDTNGDGCFRPTAATLRVLPSLIGTVAPSGPNSTVTVRFRVTIN
jgi:uncharacterized repeat protein (TIGR01451 family)